MNCRKCGNPIALVSGFRGGKHRLPGDLCRACRDREEREDRPVVTPADLEQRLGVLRTAPVYLSHPDIRERWEAIIGIVLPRIQAGETSLEDWEKMAPKGWNGNDYQVFHALTRGV